MNAEARSEVERLREENAELHARLTEAEQTLAAIQGGEVDALVIDSPHGQQIFSLTGAERPYRELLEQMSEGAVTLDAGGFIRYSNQAFAGLLRQPLEQLVGGPMDRYVAPADGEIALQTADDTPLPAYLSVARLPDSGQESVCLVITDLSERKRAERLSSSEQFVQSLIEKAPIGVAVDRRQASPALGVAALPPSVARGRSAAHLAGPVESAHQQRIFDMFSQVDVESNRTDGGQGSELAGELRRHAWRINIPLCALTGWGQDSDRQRTKDAGFTYHLTKPIDITKLEAFLQTLSAGSG